jgi:hypothetical protein
METGPSRDTCGRIINVASAVTVGGCMILTNPVHCKRASYDVYIGRPSKWGNPFSIGKDGTREEVIGKYRDYLIHHPTLYGELSTLKGKVLGCWCAPLPCHGDVLIEEMERSEAT